MLNKYRAEIDQLDQQIIELLDKRFEVTKLVGEYKAENSLPILNSDREKAIITQIKAMDLNHEPEIINVYIALLHISKGQQDE